MKNYFFIFYLITISCSSNSGSDSFINFSGSIKNTKEKILKITNYNSTLKQELKINDSGDFSGMVNIESDGYYSFQIGRSYTNVRFKKGSDVKLSLDADSFFTSIEYSGELKKVNNYNVSKSKLRSRLVGDSKEYFVVPLNDFLKKIEKTRDSLFYLLDKTELAPKDKILERKIIKYEYLQSYNNYKKFYTYHKNTDPILPDDYYEPIINMDTDDDEIFKYSRPYRNLIIENYRITSKIFLKNNPKLGIIDFVEEKIKTINSTDIKDQFSSMLIRQMNENNINIEKDYLRIIKILKADRLKNKLTMRYNSAKISKEGATSVEFAYENFNGDTTSLESLKGKLLYIDVWATWCGPCIKEMPYLRTLVGDYIGKKIEFVSISIDSKNDYEKWRKMVIEKNIGGIQLYNSDGLESEFMKAFSVSIIPRFMMIDNNGNIITGNAPRPSSSNVRNYINRYLEKNTIKRFNNS
tara:strand:- start:275 stop:1675 length:1401 start_codon:yes stop_codon:yes gene_type:complete